MFRIDSTSSNVKKMTSITRTATANYHRHHSTGAGYNQQPTSRIRAARKSSATPAVGQQLVPSSSSPSSSQHDNNNLMRKTTTTTTTTTTKSEQLANETSNQMNTSSLETNPCLITATMANNIDETTHTDVSDPHWDGYTVIN